MIRYVKPIKYMGKLKPCHINDKVLCVCKEPKDCLEDKIEKVTKECD